MTTIIGKADLAQLVAANTQTTQAAARLMIDAVFDQIAASAEAGHQIRMTGFGTFAVRETAARLGRNPRTGETIEVPAGRRRTFKASKSRPS